MAVIRNKQQDKKSVNLLYLLLLSVAGYCFCGTRNEKVGGSIPLSGTIFTHSVKAHRQVNGGNVLGQCADGNIVHTGFCIGPNIIQRDVT